MEPTMKKLRFFLFAILLIPIGAAKADYYFPPLPPAPQNCMDAIIQIDDADPAAGSTVDLDHPVVCQITIRLSDGHEVTYINDVLGSYQVTGFGTKVGSVRRVDPNAAKILQVFIFFAEMDPVNYLPMVIAQ